MKKIIIGGVLSGVLLLGFASTPLVTRAQTTDITSMLEQIKQLTTLLIQLQTQIADLRGEVTTLRESLKDNLNKGVTDEDIKKVQEVLASDHSIYPAGLVTGYYGPMTEEALKHFQEKFNLEVTGEINTETRSALEILLNERSQAGNLPWGLLNAPGLRDKFEKHFKEECEQEDTVSKTACTETIGQESPESVEPQEPQEPQEVNDESIDDGHAGSDNSTSTASSTSDN